LKKAIVYSQILAARAGVAISALYVPVYEYYLYSFGALNTRTQPLMGKSGQRTKKADKATLGAATTSATVQEEDAQPESKKEAELEAKRKQLTDELKNVEKQVRLLWTMPLLLIEKSVFNHPRNVPFLLKGLNRRRVLLKAGVATTCCRYTT
jgi:hypothetical protein